MDAGPWRGMVLVDVCEAFALRHGQFDMGEATSVAGCLGVGRHGSGGPMYVVFCDGIDVLEIGQSVTVTVEVTIERLHSLVELSVRLSKYHVS